MNARFLGLCVLSLGTAFACTDDVEVGADLPALPDASSTGGGATPDDSGAADSGAAGCVQVLCEGAALACGDCVDNDQDGLVDLDDPDCLGECQNAEDTFFGSVVDPNPGRCALDCYFDDDSGFGNDGCTWSHHCDPLSVAPGYPPSGESCAYAPEEPILGASGLACETAAASQSETCLETCLPRTPKGCDCFGCCLFPDAPGPVWIGSRDAENRPTCTRDAVADETRCRPCTQVASCLVP